jgi:hypothetical protein
MKQTLSVMLAVGGACGTILTAHMTRMAALKERSVVDSTVDFDKKTIKERIKLLAPVYTPTIVVGAVTVGSIVGSSVISQKAQASLMSMAVLADQGWRKYKHQVKKTLGLETNDKIISNIAKDVFKKTPNIVSKPGEPNEKELYFEEHVGFFYAKPEDVAIAYGKLNEVLTTNSQIEFTNENGSVKRSFNALVTLSAFFKFCKAEFVNNEIVDNDVLNRWGWTLDYLLDSFENAWVHMRITLEESEDKVVPIRTLSFIEDAIYLQPEDFYDDGRELSLEGLNVLDIDGIIFTDLRGKK